MIIDYKNELLHRHTALQAILFAYRQYIINIQKEDEEESENYRAPLNAILSCIAGSHKLDHIRLCCDKTSRHSQLFEQYKAIFSGKRNQSNAVAKYQSARLEDCVEGMKPYQVINAFLADKNLTPSQKTQARLWF